MAHSLGYYTRSELSSLGKVRAASTNSVPAALLRHRAFKATDTDQFDVFLSHSSTDAATILGVVEILERQQLRVYVDWIVDSHLDRIKVDRDTADTLRRRLNQSRSLIYATSTASRSSIWMPWELGYFDGIGRQNRISVMPIDTDTPGHQGQEYLDLYPAIEKVSDDSGHTITAAVDQQSRNAVSVRDFARGLA